MGFLAAGFAVFGLTLGIGLADQTRFNASLKGIVGVSSFFSGGFMFQPYKGKFVSRLDTLKARPIFAARIGHTIAMWSAIEIHLSQLLSIILRADAQVGATLFSAIRAESGRLAMIRAIAEERLPPDLFAEYLALQKRVSSVGSHRDAMAHGSWALSQTDPDCLILVDSRYVGRYIAAAHSNLSKENASLLERQKAAAAMKNYLDSARRYGDVEFDYIEKEIKAVRQEIKEMAAKVSVVLALPHAPSTPAKKTPPKKAGTLRAAKPKPLIGRKPKTQGKA